MLIIVPRHLAPPLRYSRLGKLSSVPLLCSSSYVAFDGLAHTPAQILFFSQAAKQVDADNDSLIELFETLDHFFRRLRVYCTFSEPVTSDTLSSPGPGEVQQYRTLSANVEVKTILIDVLRPAAIFLLDD